MFKNQDDFNIKFTLRAVFDAIHTIQILSKSGTLYEAYTNLKKEKNRTPTQETSYISDAVNWFKNQVKSVLSSSTNSSKQVSKVDQKILDAYNTTSTFEVGKMYLFHYDPKHKKTLPYYDTFPLIIMMGFTENGKGFYGINLHYLAVPLRTVLLSNLLNNAILKDGKLEKLYVSYDIVKNVSTLEMFRPCFKQYLTAHIRGAIKMIPPDDWGYAAILPIENFKKATKQQVWKESADSLK